MNNDDDAPVEFNEYTGIEEVTMGSLASFIELLKKGPSSASTDGPASIARKPAEQRADTELAVLTHLEESVQRSAHSLPQIGSISSWVQILWATENQRENARTG